MIAVRTGIAEKPGAYSWRQHAGAGPLAGIRFTMSLFIAGQAFPSTSEFAAAKTTILVASVSAGTIGTIILWNAKSSSEAYKHARAPGASSVSGRTATDCGFAVRITEAILHDVKTTKAACASWRTAQIAIKQRFRSNDQGN
ncbi:Na+/H+ antiporter NhaA [Mesorhizobium sp. VK22B]|uniref:Putative Na(+)/H(+) antiporter NhaA homolog n=1 Tax=Mesorhizobium captivum TaxID=3072319 RepID=A0ABU4Z9Z1_9HYPH|nr:Na+/H+ antiporter NhaA [Mesorhizobium sp. VK22B]MDX8494767.1 Na+/H+ antiporter NhaA [Mesorhizobium sp. VK22B]